MGTDDDQNPFLRSRPEELLSGDELDAARAKAAVTKSHFAAPQLEPDLAESPKPNGAPFRVAAVLLLLLAGGGVAAWFYFADPSPTPAAVAVAPTSARAHHDVAPSLSIVLDQAQDSASLLEVKAVGNAIDLYEAKYGHLPARLHDLVPNEIRSIRPDRWGHPLQYLVTGHRYAVTSAGPDGRFGTADDLRVSGGGQ